MLSILPDILNDYRDSLLRQKTPFEVFRQIPPSSSESNQTISSSNNSNSATISSEPVYIDALKSNSSISSPNSRDSSTMSCEPMSFDSSDELISGLSDNEKYSLFKSGPISHKRLNLSPSFFVNGCFCGHNFGHRDIGYNNKKRHVVKCSGVTIKPKIPPITPKMRVDIL
jgi:hypothetical protein